MLITCISDIHGNLLPNLPKSDLLIIAGDICPTCDHSIIFQSVWLRENFWRWVKGLQQDGVAKYIVFIAGNHDFVFEQTKRSTYSWSNGDHPMKGYQGIYYLQDNSVEIEGVKIFGTPWQLPFFDWAFNAPEDNIEEVLKKVEPDTDIIVSHGPPKFHGDRTQDECDSGSISLLNTIKKVKPKLVVTGHIHEAYGEYQCGQTTILNASVVNRKYHLTNSPLQFTIEQTSRSLGVES